MSGVGYLCPSGFPVLGPMLGPHASRGHLDPSRQGAGSIVAERDWSRRSCSSEPSGEKTTDVATCGPKKTSDVFACPLRGVASKGPSPSLSLLIFILTEPHRTVSACCWNCSAGAEPRPRSVRVQLNLTCTCRIWSMSAIPNPICPARRIYVGSRFESFRLGRP